MRVVEFAGRACRGCAVDAPGEQPGAAEDIRSSTAAGRCDGRGRCAAARSGCGVPAQSGAERFDGAGQRRCEPVRSGVCSRQVRGRPGPLKRGDILVSNFNNSKNLQGTGTTIVRIAKSGPATTFFQGAAGLGLSTALGVLREGLIVVGDAPTTDGTAATATPGSLLVLNNQGKLLQTISNAEIQYPWDMALVDNGDEATAFVSNALTGTVVRLKFKVSGSGLQVLSTKAIASGYVHRGDPVTLFVAPTGLIYDRRRDILFVASTGDNTVFAVKDAAERKDDDGVGRIVYQDNVHLHGPLGMVRAPNGHLLVSNNDGINPDANQPSEIVEFTTDGTFVKQLSVDPNQGGAFGLAVRTTDDAAVFAAVNDNTATLLIWTLNTE
jgi:hypothetical protein